ncbi:MAG: TlpA disulfide reductase family protein, partial [Ginsengibacter sp.]
FIMSQKPNQYKRTVDSIRDLKLAFVNQARYAGVSPRLKQNFEDEANNIVFVRKFNYPSQHKSFNKGIEAELPSDYYDFADKVVLSPDLDNKGVPYLRSAHFFLTNKYQLAKENGYDKDYLTFVGSELSGRAKYIYLAYSLTSDFNADTYYQFGANCPYKDIAEVVKTRFGHLEKMLPGKPSPDIILNTVKNENIASKDFFKGKLTYIDMWATWCKPCIAEFPDLAILKTEYKNENIQFVSISSDEKRDTWLNYVEKQGLSGSQFWVDNESKKLYNKGFNINMIPRFILLDGKGNIINANAPRPSSGKEIRNLLNKSIKES